MEEQSKVELTSEETAKAKEVPLTPEQLEELQIIAKKQLKGYRQIKCPMCGQVYFGRHYVKVVVCGKCGNKFN